MFDERELKFEIGDGESLGLPAGVEKAITAMEQGEEALFHIKPKYDHIVVFLYLCCHKKNPNKICNRIIHSSLGYNTQHCNTVLS